MKRKRSRVPPPPRQPRKLATVRSPSRLPDIPLRLPRNPNVGVPSPRRRPLRASVSPLALSHSGPRVFRTSPPRASCVFRVGVPRVCPPSQHDLRGPSDFVRGIRFPPAMMPSQFVNQFDSFMMQRCPLMPFPAVGVGVVPNRLNDVSVTRQLLSQFYSLSQPFYLLSMDIVDDLLRTDCLSHLLQSGTVCHRVSISKFRAASIEFLLHGVCAAAAASVYGVSSGLWRDAVLGAYEFAKTNPLCEAILKGNNLRHFLRPCSSCTCNQTQRSCGCAPNSGDPWAIWVPEKHLLPDMVVCNTSSVNCSGLALCKGLVNSVYAVLALAYASRLAGYPNRAVELSEFAQKAAGSFSMNKNVCVDLWPPVTHLLPAPHMQVPPCARFGAFRPMQVVDEDGDATMLDAESPLRLPPLRNLGPDGVVLSPCEGQGPPRLQPLSAVCPHRFPRNLPLLTEMKNLHLWNAEFQTIAYYYANVYVSLSSHIRRGLHPATILPPSQWKVTELLRRSIPMLRTWVLENRPLGLSEVNSSATLCLLEHLRVDLFYDGIDSVNSLDTILKKLSFLQRLSKYVSEIVHPPTKALFRFMFVSLRSQLLYVAGDIELAQRCALDAVMLISSPGFFPGFGASHFSFMFLLYFFVEQRNFEMASRVICSAREFGKRVEGVLMVYFYGKEILRPHISAAVMNQLFPVAGEAEMLQRFHSWGQRCGKFVAEFFSFEIDNIIPEDLLNATTGSLFSSAIPPSDTGRLWISEIPESLTRLRVSFGNPKGTGLLLGVSDETKASFHRAALSLL